MEKHSFKPLCWYVNENCDVDVAIDRAGYQSEKTAGKNYPSSFLRSFYYASFTFGYLWYSSSTASAANDNSKKGKHYSRVFTFLCVELRALLSNGPPSRVRKLRSCEVKILIARRKRAKNSLSTKRISQKLIQ